METHMSMRTIVMVGGLAMATVSGAEAQRGRPRDPEAARAEANAAQARALFLEGQEAYARGEYERAIALWRQAFELDAAPALQYNLAQAYGRLGDVANELAALAAFVEAAAPNDPNVPTSRLRIDALRERMARTGVQLTGVAADAEVTVDDVVVPNPAEGAIVAPEPGSHRIHVRLRGHRPFDAVVEVVPGRTTEVAVVQDEIPEPPAPVAGYALLAGGGAMVLTGVVTGTVGFLDAPDTYTGTSAGDHVRRLGIVTDAMVFGGGAVAATGLVMVLLREDRESDGFDSAALQVLPYADRSGAGVVLGGRF